MEKISAARAMEWSVDLEVGLRSKKPGRPAEAILETGRRLQQWSRERDITLATANMYGLLPGEDRTFANTILLRLAEAFRRGDRRIRVCVIKAFLMELKHMREKGRRYDGILCKRRVPNHSELLSRVKIVYDVGDSEAKALSLRLLGCWADFAKDSAEIRFMVISSLRSEMPFDVKRAAVRTLGRMRCSAFITNRAYKAGKKLVMASRGEDIAVEMLPSLSILAFKSMPLIPEQITSMVKQSSHGSHGGEFSEVSGVCQGLLRLILRLVEEYPALGFMVLDKIKFVIKDLVKISGEVPDKENTTQNPSLSLTGIAESVVKHDSCFTSELVICICRFMDSCLEILDEAGAVTSEVNQTLKPFLEQLHQSCFDRCDLYVIVSLLFHSQIMWHYCGAENNVTFETRGDRKEVEVGSSVVLSHDVCWVDHEWKILEFSKNMMERNNYWAVYRLGKYSACQGAWFAAAFTFRKLIDRVQSHSCRCWLRSLMLLAGAESEIKLILFPKQGSQIIIGLQRNDACRKPSSADEEEDGRGAGGHDELHYYQEKLESIYGRICSAEKTLTAISTSDGFLYFQRWFLNLRAKVLEVLVDILGLLISCICCEEKINNDGRDEEMYALASKFVPIAFRLKKLAKEYDLLATCFMDIDCRSARSIARLALNCSMLAFCTIFPVYFAKSTWSKNMISGNCPSDSTPAMLIQDLIERLFNADSKCAMDLQSFLGEVGDVSSNIQSRTRIHKTGYKERAIASFSRSAISKVLHLQEMANGAKDEHDLCKFLRAGLQILSKLIKEWMYIPFEAPKYYFQARPCVGAEIFIFNANSRDRDEISVIHGFHLSLNLCIQFKNATPHLQSKVSRMYCIIAVSPFDPLKATSGETIMENGFRGTDELVDLNERCLYASIDQEEKKTNAGDQNLCSAKNNDVKEMLQGAEEFNVPNFGTNRRLVASVDGGLHDHSVLVFNADWGYDMTQPKCGKFCYPSVSGVKRPNKEEDIAFMTVGPLHGIPYGLKDIIAVPHYKTTWGSVNFKDQIIDMEAWVYKKLKSAGGVLVAKLVTGSLAYDDIWFGGRTRNPWNIEEFSTGSSAGPAASTSAGMVPFAIGSETAGSITYPSARCGVTALRPTFGTVGRTGVMSISESLKCHRLCSNSDAIRGKDPDDFSSKDVAVQDPFSVDITKLTVGYLQDAEMEVVHVLASKGVSVIPFKLEYSVENVQSILNFTMDVDMLSHFDKWQRAGLDSEYEAQDQWPMELRRARLIPAVDYLQAQRVRGKLIREVQQGFTVDAFIGNATDWEKVCLGNLVGLPVIVIPTGLKDIKDPPKGGTRRRTTITTGIYAPPDHDHIALALAMAHHKQRPPIDNLTPNDPVSMALPPLG
ncbi:Fatty acid amide hydrolase [Acorus calamus]|uniref:Fatty acid amide hydrolase n=1 Tax=Acorus calamus TaxID=4465 RepID=A0AAV9F1D4_ACOCL|nr:Fatty acid amide hydrolase [Acorus calamus]